MKFLTLVLLATTILSTNVKAVDPQISNHILGVSISPTGAITLCGFGTGDNMCAKSIIYNLPLSTTTALILLKEDAYQVEADAYNFLAGEEITLALAEQMEKIREIAPELENATDEELVALTIFIAKN